AGLVAPEFQIETETSLAGYINFLQWSLRWGYKDVKPTYVSLHAIAHDTPMVVAWLNLHLSGNQLSDATCALIAAALASKNVTAASSDSDKLDMIAAACLLVMSAPEYLVQK
ncbi:MAG: DUF1800 domain-containing protein, partial [Sphingomonas bacterium]